MPLYGPKELAASLRTVRENTIKIAEDIPEERFGYRPTPESRSVEQLLLHILAVAALTRQMHEGERIQSFPPKDFRERLARLPIHEDDHRAKSEILSRFQEEGESFIAWLE